MHIEKPITRTYAGCDGRDRWAAGAQEGGDPPAEAALRLAVEQGLDGITVEAIADAANVSRRTFSNYFSSKEEALFHGDTMRLRRLLQLIREQPAGEPPWAVLSRAAERLTEEAFGDRDPPG
ncbi:hypothetical protein GCM10027614_82070 [Micromonospora vulcania]